MVFFYRKNEESDGDLEQRSEEPYFAEVLNLRSGGYESCDFSMVHSPQQLVFSVFTSPLDISIFYFG
jgi:hypothetical protein